jgi:hypothetical protein
MSFKQRLIFGAQSSVSETKEVPGYLRGYLAFEAKHTVADAKKIRDFQTPD